MTHMAIDRNFEIMSNKFNLYLNNKSFPSSPPKKTHTQDKNQQ